jgi:hypothetical protein
MVGRSGVWFGWCLHREMEVVFCFAWSTCAKNSFKGIVVSMCTAGASFEILLGRVVSGIGASRWSCETLLMVERCGRAVMMVRVPGLGLPLSATHFSPGIAFSVWTARASQHVLLPCLSHVWTIRRRDWCEAAGRVGPCGPVHWTGQHVGLLCLVLAVVVVVVVAFGWLIKSVLPASWRRVHLRAVGQWPMPPFFGLYIFWSTLRLYHVVLVCFDALRLYVCLLNFSSCCDLTTRNRLSIKLKACFNTLFCLIEDPT